MTPTQAREALDNAVARIYGATIIESFPNTVVLDMVQNISFKNAPRSLVQGGIIHMETNDSPTLDLTGEARQAVRVEVNCYSRYDAPELAEGLAEVAYRSLQQELRGIIVLPGTPPDEEDIELGIGWYDSEPRLRENREWTRVSVAWDGSYPLNHV